MNKIANAAIANVRHGDASDDVIRIEGIEFSWSKRGPHTLVIDDFRVARGERVFVHGPSGSGKTTLLSLLGGVVVAQKGKIDVLDERLDRMRSARRDQFRADNIGFIFQMFNLIPYLSLVDNVLLPCRFSTKRTQRALMDTASDNVAEEAARLLELLGLDTSLLYRRATALSVGQQQRVAAARALIGRPPLLIADEPTSALDADTRHVFIELLFSQCAKAGTTIIFVSHDKSLAPRFDRQVSIAEINTASQGK